LSLPTSPPGRGGSNESSNIARTVGKGVGVFRVLRVSGTIRKAEEEAVRRARTEIAQMKKAVNLGLEHDLAAGADVDGGASSIKGQAELAAVGDDEEDEGSEE
jgi:ribonuclease P/MRP protein subunit POP5